MIPGALRQRGASHEGDSEAQPLFQRSMLHGSNPSHMRQAHMLPLPLYTVTVGGATATDDGSWGAASGAVTGAAGTAEAAGLVGESGRGSRALGPAAAGAAVAPGGLALGTPVMAHGQLVVGTAVGTGLQPLTARQTSRAALNRSGSCPQPVGDEEAWGESVEVALGERQPDGCLLVEANGVAAGAGIRAGAGTGAGPRANAEAGASDAGVACSLAVQGQRVGAGLQAGSDEGVVAAAAATAIAALTEAAAATGAAECGRDVNNGRGEAQLRGTGGAEAAVGAAADADAGRGSGSVMPVSPVAGAAGNASSRISR